MLNDEIEKKILNEKKNIKGEILCNSGLLKPFNLSDFFFEIQVSNERY
jgi:hypothetical protein